MRVCPKCGYRQSECWRNKRWHLYAEYCHIEELEVFEPDLAMEIREQLPRYKYPLKRGPFFYMISRTGHVSRLDQESYLTDGFDGSVTESQKRARRLASSFKQQKIGRGE